jgi:hypothetical protein
MAQAQAQAPAKADAFFGDSAELFQPCLIVVNKGRAVKPGVKINSDGVGWGSVMAKVIFLTLKHPEIARKALEGSVAMAGDASTVAEALRAYAAKTAKKGGSASVSTMSDLDAMANML